MIITWRFRRYAQKMEVQPEWQPSLWILWALRWCPGCAERRQRSTEGRLSTGPTKNNEMKIKMIFFHHGSQEIFIYIIYLLFILFHNLVNVILFVSDSMPGICQKAFISHLAARPSVWLWSETKAPIAQASIPVGHGELGSWPASRCASWWCGSPGAISPPSLHHQSLQYWNGTLMVEIAELHPFFPTHPSKGYEIVSTLVRKFESESGRNQIDEW